MANLHDDTVGRLADALKSALADRRRTVVTSLRWQPMSEFPNVVETFDVAVVPADSGLLHGKTLVPPRETPMFLLDVVTLENGYDAEFYDHPILLLTTSVSEYVLFDPTAEVLRPSLQAIAKWDDGWRRTRCGDGVLDSCQGFRLDVRGALPTAIPIPRRGRGDE